MSQLLKKTIKQAVLVDTMIGKEAKTLPELGTSKLKRITYCYNGRMLTGSIYSAKNQKRKKVVLFYDWRVCRE